MQKKFLFILFWFLLPQAFAQSYQYELKGFYRLTSVKKPIDYILRWSEENGNVIGSYQDNYFGQSHKVTGQGDELGRTLSIKFKTPQKGIQSLVVLSSLVKDNETATTVPVSIIPRDPVGNPLMTVRGNAQFIITSLQTVAQLQEENSCIEGFGVLAGYCGLYKGVLAEEQDRRNRCNLLFADAVRFELGPDSSVILHLGEVSDLITTPGHAIGRLPLNPQKSGIDLMTRVCGQVSGVNSSNTTCKILHMTGNFSKKNDIAHFEGKYKITEEGTNNSCLYSLSMDKLDEEINNP